MQDAFFKIRVGFSAREAGYGVHFAIARKDKKWGRKGVPGMELLMGDIIVSVSLLTAGKKEELEKCLLSLQPLLRAVSSELIVVDTGCDARHRRLVEKYADKVVDFVWCDDFAKARNAGLELARGKWFLFLDDDEWFEDMSEIIDFFQTGEYKNYDYALYNQRNYEDREGKKYQDAPVGRAVCLGADTRFQYTIHEVFNHTGERVKFFDAYVHHYGYVYDTEEDKLRHAKRNIVPLLREMEREPDNLRHPLQLMQEYAVLKEHEKAITLGKRVTESFEDSDFSQIFYYNSIAVLMLKEIIQEANAAEPAAEPADKATAQSADAPEILRALVQEGEAFLRSGYIAPLAEAYIKALLVFGYRECGDYGRAIRYTEDYLRHLGAYKKDKNEYIMFLSPITEPCFGRDTLHATLENGIMAALTTGNLHQAREWNERMGWREEGDFRISELFLTTALEALTHAAPGEWEDAEAMCNLLLTRDVVADFVREYAEQQLQELPAGKQGILPLLAGLSPREWFYRQSEEVRQAGLAGQQASEPESRLQAAMLQYAQSQLTWGARLQEAVPQQKVPYLESDAYHGAVAVRSFYKLLEEKKYGEAAAELRELLRRKSDWQEAVRGCATLLQRRVREQETEGTKLQSAGTAQGAEALSDAQGAEPQSADAARGAEALSDARSAEPKGADAARPSENAEFAALAEAVKGQVRALLQMGRTQEAQEILLQLQTMLPEDEEVKEQLQRIVKKV